MQHVSMQHALKFANLFFWQKWPSIEVLEAKSEAEKSLSEMIDKIKLTCNYNVFI